MARPRLHVVPAGASELVRSNQKDIYYVSNISHLASEIAKGLVRPANWIRYQNELQLVAELIYFGFTTIYGNQTLGEEYCSSILVGQSQRPYVAANFIRRLIGILLQVGGAYTFRKWLLWLNTRIDARDLSFNLAEHHYHTLAKATALCETIFDFMSQFHLALFYAHGAFYHIAKRLTGLRYVMLRYGVPESITQSSPYKYLGWIMSVQLIIKIIDRIQVQRESWNSQKFSMDRSVNIISSTGQLQCILCLNTCRSQTSTPCGHIFCWNCIVDWSREKEECPLCRSGVLPRQLVHLQNFST